MTATSQPTISPAQANMLARQAILANAVPRFNEVFTTVATPANTPTLNIPPRYVGLIRSFRVVISGTVKNNDSVNTLTLTDLGLSNILAPNSGVVLTDLANYQRINTSGWHLAMVNSAKHRKPFASGFALETDEMMGFGETFPILQAPLTIAPNGTGTFRAVWDVPVSYSPDDLRGGIFANVVNSTMNLALTFNSAAFTAAGTDSTFAVYKGTATAAFGPLTITVYQDYLDQLPVGQNGIVTPVLDVSTAYELKNTMVPAVVANVDNPYQYSNFRQYLSTLAIYNSNPSADAGRNAGTDINTWALQVANFSNIWKCDPLTQSQFTRDVLNTDLPKGCYYFSTRRKPINTLQYGNQQLVLNPSISVGGVLHIGLEAFANMNQVSQAGSIAA